MSNGLYQDQDQHYVLIWVQAVCKGYQHRQQNSPLVRKELVLTINHSPWLEVNSIFEKNCVLSKFVLFV